MSDPTPLVDHVYQLWINAPLDDIRNGECGNYKYDYKTDLLEALYSESKVQLPGSPLHNNNINYYNHSDSNRRPTTHVYTPSKMYLFLEMKENVLHQIENREHKVKIQECALVIQSPDASVTNSLFVELQQVIEKQALVDLRLFDVSCKFPLEPEVFRLSTNAQSSLMRSCSFPLQLLENLVHKLSDCNTVSIIDFSNTNLVDVSSLTLSNKTSLTHLDLSMTNMSAELCRSICQQLTDITRLKYLSMARNDLSLVSKFRLDNKRNLRYLSIENTKMSAELCESIFQQLTNITHLEYLNLSENDLSQMSKFTLNNKRTLKYLNLRNTHMSSTLYHTICEQLTDLQSLEQFLVSTEDFCYQIYGECVTKCYLSNTHLPSHICRRVLHQINRFSTLWWLTITNPLTGCLSSFLPDPHPGLPELVELSLRDTALSKEDLQHLSQITASNKLPNLSTLNLSRNTLTECLSSLLPDPHPELPKITNFQLKNTALNKEDVQHLFNIIQRDKLPKLRILDLSQNTLTGCLSTFAPDPHPGLPELQWLHLKSTSLNKDDLQHLLSIAHKFPKLCELDLSSYALTGCLSSFLQDPHPGLPELYKLELNCTALNKEDLLHLFSIIQLNKLPKLHVLDLSHNTLTGCLSSFLTDPHPGLPELKYLDLESTDLNKDDLQHLLSITYKLPKLHKLDLSGYTLTGCLSSFLLDPHQVLPSLEGLYLRTTELKTADLQHLTHLIQTHKLPGLKYLDLHGNRFSEMETDVKDLIEACVNHHQR